MLLLVAALASFAVPGAVHGVHAHLLSAAMAVHFLKRVLEVRKKTNSTCTLYRSMNGLILVEIVLTRSISNLDQVLFVHRYSGSMPLATSLLIAGCYLFNGGAMIYVQHLSRGLPEPSMDLLYPVVLAFAVGLAGNFYHHHLLSRLRADSGGDGDDKKGYKIPTGGLFGLVTCPHYLFEILAFFGFAMIAQTRSTRSPWPWARRRTSLAGATPPGGGTIPSSTSSRPGSN